MLRNLTCLLLMLLLSGCISMAPPRITGPDQGAVVLRLTTSDYVRHHAGGAWSIIEFRPVGATGPFARGIGVSPQRQDYAQSYLYGGALKPGRYVIARMAMSDSSHITPGPALGQFEVKPGQLTYLGHMIQQSEFRAMRLAHPTGQPDSQEAGVVVKTAFPELAPLLGNTVLGWQPAPAPALSGLGSPALLRALAGTDAFMNERYAHIRDRAAGVLSPIQLAGGDVLFGTLLGTIRRWQPDGALTTLDLRTTHAVAALAELRNGTLLAGGEFAFLKSSTDGGQTWNDVPHNLPPGLLTDIKEMPDGRIHLTLLQRDEVQTYVGTPGKPAWDRLSAQPRSWVPAAGGVHLPPRSFVHKATVYTLVPGEQLLAYDTATDGMQTLELPGPAREFTVDRNGWIFCLCGANPLSMTNYISTNGGKSWGPLGMPPRVGMPRYRDTKTGVAMERPLVGNPRLQITRDGGTTWAPTGFGSFGFLHGYLRDGKTLLAESSGQLYFSQDEGETWAPVGGHRQGESPGAPASTAGQ